MFKCIFLNENVWIPLKISLKFIPKGPIDNIPALVQIMGWGRPGDKPLSEPMMVSLLTHIYASPSLNESVMLFFYASFMHVFIHRFHSISHPNLPCFRQETHRDTPGDLVATIFMIPVISAGTLCSAGSELTAGTCLVWWGVTWVLL